MRTHDYIHAAHMDVMVPAKRKKYLKQAKKTIRESNLVFDAIAFSGMSGAVFAPLLAMALGKELILVRKELDCVPNTHSEYRVEGYHATERYIIVDDLVSSGKSVNYMMGQIESSFANGAKCVGIYCYLGNNFLSPNDYRLDGFLKNKSSVAKIAEADDPTVARLGTPAGDALAKSLCSFTLPPNCSLSFRTVSDIPDGADMEDVPAESESMDLSF